MSIGKSRRRVKFMQVPARPWNIRCIHQNRALRTGRWVIRILMGVGLALGIEGGAGKARAATAAPEAPSHTLRLAIERFVAPTDLPSLREPSGRLLDYLTVELSQHAGFELLERSQIDKITQEMTLTSGLGFSGSNAVRI